ncbi:MAG: hypothetical protein Q6361_07010 [Candidatus Hermodarchaeota archaeon]|nr:hypothetical protein [Candidatus Hermodarchaeota archaeon]
MKKVSEGTETIEVDKGYRFFATIPVADLFSGKYKLTWKITLEKLDGEEAG